MSLINEELGLEYCAGDPEFYQEMVQAYLDEAEDKLNSLKSYYEAKDWKNYAVMAHAIKSTSLTIGAESLSALAKEHEFAGKEERVNDINATYDKLLELYKQVMDELNA